MASPPLSSPSSLPQPSPQSQALSPGQGGPAWLGGDPKHILPLTVMLQKLKTHLQAGCPPSFSSQKVAEEALGLNSVPRVMDACKPSACSSWDRGPKLDSGALAVTCHTQRAHPPTPVVPEHPSEPQAPDGQSASLRLNLSVGWG